MARIQIRGLQEVKKMFSQLKDGSFKKAMEVTINTTAGQVRERLKTEIKTVFDRPVPYTYNKSLFIDRAIAEISKFNAQVFLKGDWAASGINDAGAYPTSGTPATNYLSPHIFGGGRKHKSSEKTLQRSGILDADEYIVPGPHAKRDSYGNMSQGQMIQILTALGVGFVQPKKKYKGSDGWFYYVDYKQKNIFAVKGKQIKLLLYIVKNPQYKKRFKFYEVGYAEANDKLIVNASESLDYELNKLK